jgi:hypothetical protein
MAIPVSEVRMTAVATEIWRRMATAPKDGSRILVSIRSTEQGPAEVDVVRWSKPKRDPDACWMSTDSSADCSIVYEAWELAFWMPLPTGMPPVRTPGLAAQLPPAPKADEELDGSGI